MEVSATTIEPPRRRRRMLYDLDIPPMVFTPTIKGLEFFSQQHTRIENLPCVSSSGLPTPVLRF